MPQWLVDLVVCWMGWLGKFQSGNSWKAIPLCLMWAIWREQSSRAFEGLEQSMTELKILVLHSLFEWISKTPGHLSSNFVDFLDSCTS